MKKLIKGVLSVIGLLALVLVLYLVYLGVFKNVKVTERETGPYNYVYLNFVGPYAKTGPVFEKVGKALAANGIKATTAIGIYYDAPKSKPANELRSDCGMLIADKDIKLAKKLDKEYKIAKLPKAKRAVVEFNLKSKLSYLVGPMKAYPALMKYAEKNHKTITMAYEIYMEKAKKIYYLVDLVESEVKK